MKIKWSGNVSTRWRAVGAAAAVIALLFAGAPAFAAKGGTQGPPTGGESPNNLSLPAIQTESASSVAASWVVPAAPVLGEHYSYGCAVPESDGQFSYPNTSCVDDLANPGTYYTADECTDEILPSPCRGYEVSRIYWQKVDVNEWWADDEGILMNTPNHASVAYVDWGDALEAVSWNERSVIRVETQPYASTIPGFDPTLGACADATGDPDADCKVGFQMWHVSGQGITEHWGVRATDAVAALPYSYDSPFQIIHTTNARLNLAKLAPGSAECSMPGGNPGDESPGAGAWLGAGWQGVCTYYDAPYSIETSVGGKYVYGYNWRMKNVELDSVCPGYEKTGFWRLTFYAPQDVMFDDPAAPNVAPPASPAEPRELPTPAFSTAIAMDALVTAEAEDEEDPDADDRLYRPVVDTANNLTYLDICIIGKSQGGGGGKGGGSKGGGKGGGTGGGGKGGGGNH